MLFSKIIINRRTPSFLLALAITIKLVTVFSLKPLNVVAVGENGFVIPTKMQSREFVDLLNDNKREDADWFYDYESINRGYPVFICQKEILKGDVNDDGEIDNIDLILIQNHLLRVKKLSGYAFLVADMNRDGKVDIVDLLLFKKELLKNIVYDGQGFAWPVPGYTYISEGFGLSGRDHHNGIDIVTNWAAGQTSILGKPVIASADGVVIRVQSLTTGYGKCIVIDHGEINGCNYITLYAHLSAMQVSEGETVKQGQVIGNVGNTGNASVPHLHFEIRVDGTTCDPLNYLKKQIY